MRPGCLLSRSQRVWARQLGRNGGQRARGTCEVVLVGVAHGGAAVGDAELAVDVGEVELDRVLAQPQVMAYRLGRATVGDSAQDRGLARRELWAGRDRGPLPARGGH